MDDLKKLTVRYLRALARKRIGEGHSKLKTKAQLLEALKDWLPKILQPKRPRRVKAGARVGKAAAKVSRLAGEAGGEQRAKPTRAERLAEPLVEGFFVARVAGDGEARRHGLTEASATPSPSATSGDGAADFPESQADPRMHALARDPATLFAFWDFPKASWQRAARGLRSPRPVLRIYQGRQLVREVEISPESRGFYVHQLSPGQRYRVEAHLLAVDGRSRQVGYPSDIVELPKSSLSKGEARFARLEWGSDLGNIDGGRARVLDQRSAQRLAEAIGPPASAAPFHGSSERRSWLFSPSGSGRQ